jgi:hypothetical protein
MRSTVIPESVAWHGPALPTDRYLQGYEKTGRALDADGEEAVRLMDAFLADPAHRLDLWVERDRRHFRG